MWSKAQKALLSLAKETLDKGECCTVDKVEAFDRDLKEQKRLDLVGRDQIFKVLDTVERQSKMAMWDGPLNIVSYAETLSTFVSSMSLIAKTKGRDRLTRMWKALDALTGTHERTAITIWLCEARRLPVNDQESIFFLLSYIARALNIQIRVVALTGAVWRYDSDARETGIFPCRFSSRLRARKMELCKAGLEDMEEEEQSTPLLREVKAG